MDKNLNISAPKYESGKTSVSIPLAAVKLQPAAEPEKKAAAVITSGNTASALLPETYSFTVSSYSPSGNAAYQSALKKLSAAYSDMPVYKSRYDDEIADLYEQMVSRPDFSYDPSADPLYRQYRERYTALGKTAMEDAVGKAASLTGGYGSTYGEVAGKQQYDLWLSKLFDLMPELYSRAYSRYKDDADSLKTQYDLLTDKEESDYKRYRDRMGDYQKTVSALQDEAETAYEQGYKNYWAAENLAFDNYWKSLNYALALEKQKG